VITIPIFLIGFEDGFVAEAWRQDMALAGETVLLDVSVLEGDVYEVGVGCDRIGLGLVVVEGGDVLSADLVDVFESEPAVGVVAIDV